MISFVFLTVAGLLVGLFFIYTAYRHREEGDTDSNVGFAALGLIALVLSINRSCAVDKQAIKLDEQNKQNESTMEEVVNEDAVCSFALFC